MNKTGNAYYDFCEMIRKSWTFERLTEDEKSRCWDALHFPVQQNLLKGCYSIRFGFLQSVYTAFLYGIGYDGGFNWREPDPEILF